MADKYDDAIAYLTECPGEIIEAWCNPSDHPGGCLFDYAGRRDKYGDVDAGCGCLTQIAGGIMGAAEPYVAANKRLTKAIRADKRIPVRPEDITVADLPVFAEWQRRLDKELGRGT